VKIGKLLDAESEKVALDAAKRVLGIAGIKPANESQISVRHRSESRLCNFDRGARRAADEDHQPRAADARR
jgi:hypothetical protein